MSDFEPKHSTVISQYDRYGNSNKALMANNNGNMAAGFNNNNIMNNNNSGQKSMSFNWAGTYNTDSQEKQQYLSLM